MTTIWHNGKFITDGPVFIPSDRLRIGDGVFDTMLALDGRLLHGTEHFTRLLAHAGIMTIECNITSSSFIEIAHSLLAQNKFANGRYVINTIITRGPAQRGLKIPDQATPQTVMTISPAPMEFPPVEAVIAKHVRRNEGSPLSQIKSCNYGDSILALSEAKEAKVNEAILRNNRGDIACASGSNIFIIKDGRLSTPPLKDGAMDGIIRQKMIAELGAAEHSVTPNDLFNCDGVYMANSVRGVVPVATLDGKRLRPPSLEIDKDFHLI